MPIPAEGVLSRAVKHRLSKNTADVGILDGMRWGVDNTMVREFPAEGIKSIVIYVTADDDHRYARLMARNRSGEAATTREQFADLIENGTVMSRRCTRSPPTRGRTAGG